MINIKTHFYVEAGFSESAASPTATREKIKNIYTHGLFNKSSELFR